MSENVTKSPRGRVKRAPVNARGRLTIHNKDSNYEYRIVNDVDDRIEMFKQSGWEVVAAKDIRVGDPRVEAAKPMGSSSEISVGGGTKATVMRIQKDWYAEDQRAKQADIDKLEQTMKEDAQRDNYGSISFSRD